MRKEIRIGLLGLFSLFILIFGYRYLKGQNLLESSQVFYIRYNDVNGMTISSMVKRNGFKVGSVIDLQLDPEDPNFILVTIDVDKRVRMPKDAVAVVVSEGILGDKSISLEFDEICTSNCLPTKSFIKGSSKGLLSSLIGSKDEVGEYVDQAVASADKDGKLQETIGELNTTVKNLNSLTKKIDDLLANTSSSLARTVVNVERITKELENSKGSLSSTLANMDKFSQKLEASNIEGVVNNADKMMNSADAAIKSFESTLSTTNASVAELKNLLTSINNGQGTMGKLIAKDELHDQLLRVSKNLDFLLQDVRLNPKRYINVSVFGKKQKEYEKTEDDPAFE